MKFYGRSHVGSVRLENQDRFGIYDLRPGLTLCVVCDGMGGVAGGSVASGIAIEKFTDMMRECIIPENPADEPDLSDKKVRAALRTAAEAANTAVWNKSRENGGKLSGMGTTLVGLLVSEAGNAWSVNVGDSRIYRAVPGKLYRQTKDHSYVQQLIDSGKLTAESARTSPVRNIITRAIGIEKNVEPDVASVDLSPIAGAGIKLLVCSDGLYGPLSDETVSGIIFSDAGTGEKVDALVDAANAAGGPDNITVILAELD